MADDNPPGPGGHRDGGDAGLGSNGQQGFQPPPPGYAQPVSIQVIVQPMHAQPMYGQQGPVQHSFGYQGGFGQQADIGAPGFGQQGGFGLQGPAQHGFSQPGIGQQQHGFGHQGFGHGHQGFGNHTLGQQGVVPQNFGQQCGCHHTCGQHNQGHQRPNQDGIGHQEYGRHSLGQPGLVHPNPDQQDGLQQGLGQNGLGHQDPNAGHRDDDHESGTGQARQGDEDNARSITPPTLFRLIQPVSRAAINTADDAAPAEERSVPNVSDNQSAGGPQHHAPVQAVQQHQDDDGESGLDGPETWDYGRHTLEWQRFVPILRRGAERAGESITFEAPKDGKGPVVNVGPKIFAICQKEPLFRTYWKADSE